MFIVLEYEMHQTDEYCDEIITDMRFHRADSQLKARHLMYKLYSDEVVETVRCNKWGVHDVKAVMTTESGKETVALFCHATNDDETVRVYQVIPENLFFSEQPNLFGPSYYYDWKWYEDYRH